MRGPVNTSDKRDSLNQPAKAGLSGGQIAGRGSARRVALCGLLTALMLTLGYVESRIQLMPAVPGIKPGLANGVLLYGVWLLPPALTTGLMLVKVLLSALFFGNPFGLAFSLAGGVLSLLGMQLMRRFTGFGVISCGVVGALLHNAGQLLVAVPLMGNVNLLYYAPVLALAGIGAGLLTGFAAGLVIRVIHPGPPP